MRHQSGHGLNAHGLQDVHSRYSTVRKLLAANGAVLADPEGAACASPLRSDPCTGSGCTSPVFEPRLGLADDARRVEVVTLRH